MKKFFKSIATIIITAIITLNSAFLLLGGDLSRAVEQVNLMRKITIIDSKVNKNAMYFDSDSQKVSDTLAKAYLGLIDDNYSIYFDNQEYSTKIDEGKGIVDNSFGIWVALKNGEKYVSVIYVNRESPANKADILQGDKLFEIDDKSLENKTPFEVASLMKENSTLTVLRDGKTFEIKVETAEFTEDSVMWKMIGNVCVINITQFGEATVEQFDKALKYAKENDAKSILFDVRNNPGGYVDSCAKILDKICPEGELVRMKLADGKIKAEFPSDSDCIDLPMAVLINNSTASAAEIFALNVKQLSGGILVGEKTYGKGIAQTTYELGDGSAIKFTTATIVDENGETYHKKGIEPDEKVEFKNNKNKFYLFMDQNEDIQLQKALQLLK